MNERPKVMWNTPEHSYVGNALGYATHNKYMKKHAQKYMDFDTQADIALSIIPADLFVPIPGKINVLFTMWEFMDVPNCYIKNFDRCDAIIVPSRFCRDVFRKVTDKPIYVCFEGVEAEQYKFHQRRLPNVSKGEKFRFLWVGAPNPRKGYPLILEAIKVFEQVQDVEIYIKTTVEKPSFKQFLKNSWDNRKAIMFKDDARLAWGRTLRRLPKPSLHGKLTRMGKNDNVIFDARSLPFEELQNLYNSAHCFLLPTFGEGWGLTLCEAMATGCPAIATGVTGCADFFDSEVGYPLRYEIKEQELQNYQVRAHGYVPSVKDMVDHMVYVCNHYPEALKKGKKASERILGKFTWNQSAMRLAEILKEIKAKKGNTCAAQLSSV